MEYVNSTEFLNAFKEVFPEVAGKWGLLNKNPYNIFGLKKWTKMMLDKKDGVLSTICKKLLSDGYYYGREYYTIDGLFLTRQSLYKPDYEGYPDHLTAIIEHELGENVEEEMWKLIFWRVPLKVLILYDWTEDEKANSPKKKEYITKKIGTLLNMLDAANKYFEENDKTEYLFLIGCRKDSKSPVYWKYCINTNTQRSKLTAL